MSCTALSSLPYGCLLAALLCPTGPDNTESKPITDEALRVTALKAIFRGMQVEIDPGKKIDSSWPKKRKAGEVFFPDALAEENVYNVKGKAVNKVEHCASEDLSTLRFSNIRQVRFRLYQWPETNDDGLLAVLQYNFPRARPAMSCASIGLLVHLERTPARWTVKNQYVVETTHHDSLQGIRLLDLTGDRVNQLVIESNWGGCCAVVSSMQIFDLSHHRFEEVLNTESRLLEADDRPNTQILDIDRTQASHGRRFCFIKTMFHENGKVFRRPRVTRPCYPRGSGVDNREQEWLAPLR